MRRRERGVPSGPSSYDALPYPTPAYPPAHPDALAVVAHLHGLTPADPRCARYVDLGCGDGANVLAVASSLPRAQCAGLDASHTAIARGQELRRRAGLDRVELRFGDLRDGDGLADLGPADYVVLHGVWSWVDDEVRERALAAAASVLARDGLLLLSYNALPGWHLLSAARMLARRRLDAEPSPDPALRAAAVRDALETASRLHARDDAYGRMLAEALNRYTRIDPVVLAHDDFAATCVPFALQDVVASARARGLHYVGEALADQWWAWRLPAVGCEQIRALGGPDAASRQQWADTAAGAAFKATVFAGPEARPAAEIDPDRALELLVGRTVDGPAARPAEPAALRDFAAALSGGARPIAELAHQAGLKQATAARAALQLTAEHRAKLHMHAPRFTHEVGERPAVAALARAQAAMGDQVATLRHTSLRLTDPLGKLLVSLLDGTRDREQLATALGAGAAEFEIADASVDRIRAVLDRQLDELARLGMLCVDEARAAPP